MKLNIGDKFTYSRDYAGIPVGTVFTVTSVEAKVYSGSDRIVTSFDDGSQAYFSDTETFEREAIKVSDKPQFSKGNRIRAIEASAFGSIEIGDEFDVLEVDAEGRVRIQLFRASKTSNIFWDAAIFKFVAPKGDPAWIVSAVDTSGRAFEKPHTSQQAAAEDVEDLMELLADTDRPFIQSITIKYQA